MPKDTQYQIACLTTAKVFIFFFKRAFTIYLKREGNWNTRPLLASQLLKQASVALYQVRSLYPDDGFNAVKNYPHKQGLKLDNLKKYLNTVYKNISFFQILCLYEIYVYEIQQKGNSKALSSSAKYGVGYVALFIEYLCSMHTSIIKTLGETEARESKVQTCLLLYLRPAWDT